MRERAEEGISCCCQSLPVGLVHLALRISFTLNTLILQADASVLLLFQPGPIRAVLHALMDIASLVRVFVCGTPKAEAMRLIKRTMSEMKGKLRDESFNGL